MYLLWSVKSGTRLLLLMSLLIVGVMIMMGGKLFQRDLVLQKTEVVQLVVPPRSETCKEQMEQREKAVASLMGKSTTPENLELVQAIRNHFIDPPSTGIAKMSLPLFKTPQAQAVDRILAQKRQGFFVECGALDGERSSNTIFFEQQRDWTGLLVEMDPSWYLQLRGKNRKSYSINACISLEQYPIKKMFTEHGMGQGQLTLNQRPSDKIRSVYCFPFYSVMLALNRSRIDYFSLDVEGFELDILKTIPFDKLDIATFSVEYAHAKDMHKYLDFMKEKGYTLHSKVEQHKPEIYFGCKDFIFVKNKGVL